MQPRSRSTKFVRSLVDAATVRPMLSALLEMKRARVRDAVVTMEVAPPAEMLAAATPLKAA